jgi:hypothetical protein
MRNPGVRLPAVREFLGERFAGFIETPSGVAVFVVRPDGSEAEYLRNLFPIDVDVEVVGARFSSGQLAAFAERLVEWGRSHPEVVSVSVRERDNQVVVGLSQAPPSAPWGPEDVPASAFRFIWPVSAVAWTGS